MSAYRQRCSFPTRHDRPMRQTRVTSFKSLVLVLNVLTLVTAAAFAQRDPPVLVKKVEQGVLERTIRQSAVLVPFEDVSLHTKVAGYVRSVDVDLGDEVKKGDVLVVIDVPELEQELAAAKASVATAGARVARAEAKARLEGVRYDITKSLHERKARTQLELVEARAQMELARADVDLARAEETEAKAGVGRIDATIAYATVKAPFDGVITSREVHPGVLVGWSGSKGHSFLLQIERRDRLRCRVEIPEKDAILSLDSLRLGTLSMKLRLDALPGPPIELDARTCQGGAAHFAKSVHPKAHHMLAEFDIVNESRRLFAGLFGAVEISASGEAGESYVLVPNTAIRAPRKGTPHVFTVDRLDGPTKVIRFDVGLHGTDGRLTQVKGLSEGAIVVVRGGADIQNGDGVRVSSGKGASR